MITMIGHNNDLFEGKCYYALICLTGRLIFYSLPVFWGEGSIAKVLKICKGSKQEQYSGEINSVEC